MPIPRKRISTMFIVALTALVLGACGGSSTPAAMTSSSDPASSADGVASGDGDGAQVRLEKFAFNPDPVSVSVGDTVTWTNEDDILHTVTSGTPQEQGVPGVTENTDSSPDGLFDQPLELGDKFSFTFEEVGDITYFCNIHPGMTGSIEVE